MPVPAVPHSSFNFETPDLKRFAAADSHSWHVLSGPYWLKFLLKRAFSYFEWMSYFWIPKQLPKWVIILFPYLEGHTREYKLNSCRCHIVWLIVVASKKIKTSTTFKHEWISVYSTHCVCPLMEEFKNVFICSSGTHIFFLFFAQWHVHCIVYLTFIR